MEIYYIINSRLGDKMSDRMAQFKLNDKSYEKSKMMRAVLRGEMFERSRQSAKLSYLNSYDEDTKETILQSIEGPIPTVLLPASQAVRSTISYYRRLMKPVFKTRLVPNGPFDPHMTHESLWSLASVKDKSQFPNIDEITKEFEEDLSLYMQMPYHEIHEAAAIAAGNQIIGKSEDILRIVQESENNLWIMINFIYERKVDFKELYKYLPMNIEIVYKSIYEITNNYKDQIIYSMINNEEVLTTIIDAFACSNIQIQKYAIRIIGNILAEAEDYAGDLTKYNLLDKIYPLLSNKDVTIKKDTCWVLSNYAFETAAANEVLSKQNIMERLTIMLRNENDIKIKNEIYYVFVHLTIHADKTAIYRFALQESLLQSCADDLDIENQDLVLTILSLIEKLVLIGEEFVDYEQEEQINPFTYYINSSNLKFQIASKSYSQNQDISSISLEILDKISGVDDLGIY